MKKYKDKNWLYQKYVIEQLSTPQIAKTCEVTKSTICVWLRKFQISTRSSPQKHQIKNPELCDKAWLEDQYLAQFKSIEQISKELKNTSVRYWLLTHNIPIREKWHNFVPKTGKDNLMFGKRGDQNPFFGKTHTIETRKKISQKRRGKNKGKNNAAWKGGVTHLKEKIRKSNQYITWRNSIFKRDGYICQNCGDRRGRNLNADHIVPFSLILEKHDISTINEAYNCKELWDISNGRTLCIECHKKTETWGHGSTKIIKKFKRKNRNIPKFVK